ncbi:retrovirus-related Pol polyprotein LINE-1, partial [Elysia marginata]
MSDTIQLGNGHDRTFDFENEWNSDDKLSDTRSIPPERSSEDKETYTFGRQLVSFCKVHDLLILNGRTEGDMKDNPVELNIGADINPVQLEGDMNNPITKKEIQNAIKKMKPDNASGPDGIPSEFYTCMCKIGVFCDYLVTLYNSVFESGIYPDEWTKSSIFALHKKGNVEDVNNYRGTSLLNVLGKIFSHVLNTRLKLWSDANKLIPEAQ